MRLYEFDHKTKSGDSITFEFQEDSEPKNRGFVVDKVIARIKGKQVGYLKIAYIPIENYKKFHPTHWNWITQLGGTQYLPFDKETVNPKDLSDEEYRNFAILAARNFLPSSESYKIQHNKSLSRHELEQIVARIENSDGFKERIKRDKKLLIDKLVDRPYVDYINTTPNIEQGNTEDYSGQGIGFALYQEGAKWMARKGLKLYASSLQRPAAAHVWKKMSDMGWVKTDKLGMYIDASALPK